MHVTHLSTRSRHLLLVLASLPTVLASCRTDNAPADKTKTEQVSGKGTQAPTPSSNALEEPEEVQQEELKVAFVYVGPVGDAGWSYAHDQARKDLESTFPWVETAFRENVPEGAEAERAITQFADRGHKLIFTTSFGYMDPTLEVAKRYPDVVFMHCSGYKQSKNVGSYFGRMYQAKYLSGLIAASMSKSNTIGFVAPHPIPEVIRHINAFTIGAREVNPKAEVRIVWTNSWFDPAKEKEAADALMDAGSDVIATGADSTAPLQAAEARGVWSIGYDSDSRAFAPNTFLTAPLWDWSIIYRKTAQEVRDGTWKSQDVWLGMDSGLVYLAPLTDKVPAEVKTLIETRTNELKEGKRKVFAGPVNKRDGGQVGTAGSALSDAELRAMDWFVPGVIGEIAK